MIMLRRDLQEKLEEGDSVVKGCQTCKDFFHLMIHLLEEEQEEE